MTGQTVVQSGELSRGLGRGQTRFVRGVGQAGGNASYFVVLGQQNSGVSGVTAGLMALLAVLLTAGGVSLIVAARRHRAELAAAAEEADPALAPLPASEPAGLWESAVIEIEPGARVERIEKLGTGYVGMGMATVGGEQTARIWSSTDAVVWQGRATLEAGMVSDVVRVNDGLMAFGHVTGLEGQPVGAAWIPAQDGRWNRITSLTAEELDGISFERAIRSGDRIVATARNRDGVSLYDSFNGAMWRAIPLPATVERVLEFETYLLGFGRHRHERRSVVVASTDGDVWEEWPEHQVVPFEMASVHVLVPFGGGFVLGGSDRLKQTALLWVSDDGIRWHRVPGDFGEGTAVESLLVTERGLVAVVSQTVVGMPGSIGFWTSDDAVVWSAVPELTINSAVYIASFAHSGEIEVIGRATNQSGISPLTRWGGVGVSASA